jgi:hypothetical protein
MSAQKFRVITVHGVNTKGVWQEEVAKALRVFFDFEPIKYNHYRWFHGTELVLSPFVWLPLGLVLVVSVLMGFIKGFWPISMGITLVLLLSLLGTYPYRNWASQTFRKRLSDKFDKGGPAPFLIAHSFGTYLSGRALLDLPWPKFERIILAGCVLDNNFPWDTLQGNSSLRFRAVRNEMAARDRIARLAAWLDRLIPGFGSAGYSGFVGKAGWVHNVESSNTVCSACVSEPGKTPIHNVKCAELGHSDVFVGPAYAVIYWLPFLWGYDPAAYQTFLSLCFEIDRTPQKEIKKSHYRALRNSSWGQSPKKTLDEEIQDAVPDGHNPLQAEELDKIASETLRFILLGQKAFDDENYSNRDKYVQFLNVFLAIDMAWKNAFPAWTSQK